MGGDLPDDKVRMTIVIDKKVVEQIEKMAERIGVSKSKMARNLVYMGLDDARVLQGLGIVHAVLAVRNFKDLIKSKFFTEK